MASKYELAISNGTHQGISTIKSLSQFVTVLILTWMLLCAGIFLGVIEEGETRFFHLFTSPSGSPRFYESRGYVLDGSCYRDAEAYLARYYDPNMEDVEVLQLLKHCVNLTAGRAIIDSREDAQKGNFHDPYVGGWVLGSIIQHGMPIPPLSFGTMCPNSDESNLEENKRKRWTEDRRLKSSQNPYGTLPEYKLKAEIPVWTITSFEQKAVEVSSSKCDAQNHNNHTVSSLLSMPQSLQTPSFQ
ncbi:hypothetical protein C5167_043548 [Papaver somniferum]|uniref:Uncharacterized protein n=1 Tax=Papaver somniferum TaxID=3469 RepID=A0A4Y7L5Z0_PAPSO|nr:hypothetical protein C5167_043548 [Papaver somniferum]